MLLKGMASTHHCPRIHSPGNINPGFLRLLGPQSAGGFYYVSSDDKDASDVAQLLAKKLFPNHPIKKVELVDAEAQVGVSASDWHWTPSSRLFEPPETERLD